MNNLKKQSMIRTFLGAITAVVSLNLTSATLTLAQLPARVDPPIPTTGLKAGSYLGKVSFKTNIHMAVRDIPGREGSFLSVLTREDGSDAPVYMYLVDPTSLANNYAMTPLTVTADGEIGINGLKADQPTLVLTITGQNGDAPEFMVTNANSGNTYGFQGTIRFSGHGSRFEWVDLKPGQYKLVDGPYNERSRHGAIIAAATNSAEDSSIESTMMMTSRDISGNFVIREKIPGFYALKPIAVKNIGVEVIPAPKFVGMFLRGCWGNGKTYFVLADPSNANRVYKLKVRK